MQLAQFCREKDLAEARRMNIETDKMELENAKMVIKTLQELGIAIDERDKLRFKGYVWGTMDSGRNLFLTSGTPEESEDAPSSSQATQNQEVNISDWAWQTGKGRLNHGQLTRLGKEVAILYRAKNGGKNPPKCTRYVDGAVRQVNSYNKDDIPLFKEAWEIMNH